MHTYLCPLSSFKFSIIVKMSSSWSEEQLFIFGSCLKFEYAEPVVDSETLACKGEYYFIV